MSTTEQPTIGRIVHYVRNVMVTPDHPTLVERPAIIVYVWPDGGSVPGGFEGMVQLQVFNDSDGGSANDGLPNVNWETSVMHSRERRPHTWHWPERMR